MQMLIGGTGQEKGAAPLPNPSSQATERLPSSCTKLMAAAGLALAGARSWTAVCMRGAKSRGQIFFRQLKKNPCAWKTSYQEGGWSSLLLDMLVFCVEEFAAAANMTSYTLTLCVFAAFVDRAARQLRHTHTHTQLQSLQLVLSLHVHTMGRIAPVGSLLAVPLLKAQRAPSRKAAASHKTEKGLCDVFLGLE